MFSVESTTCFKLEPTLANGNGFVVLPSVLFIDALASVTGSTPFISLTTSPPGVVIVLPFFTDPAGYNLPSIVTASAGYNLPSISVTLSPNILASAAS